MDIANKQSWGGGDIAMRFDAFTSDYDFNLNLDCI